MGVTLYIVREGEEVIRFTVDMGRFSMSQYLYNGEGRLKVVIPYLKFMARKRFCTFEIMKQALARACAWNTTGDFDDFIWQPTDDGLDLTCMYKTIPAPEKGMICDIINSVRETYTLLLNDHQQSNEGFYCFLQTAFPKTVFERLCHYYPLFKGIVCPV